MVRKHTEHKKTHPPILLSRTLGIWEITLLGVGALLGGGIFTLLGHAAGFAGGGLVISMALGAAISFLNLNAYVSLATTFPVAGGGYNWVRAGLGDVQGFLAGWFSWMASSVACALYAVSFGLFASEFIFKVLGFSSGDFSLRAWQLLFAVGIILLLGIINYRGVALSGKIGGYISIGILAVLAFYIFYGFKHILGSTEAFVINYTPFLPLGLAGVLQAAGLFYIAFEGSEIQAQAGEETKDPARTLKIGLFSSWAVISTFYLLIAFVIVGATNGTGGMPSWQILNGHGERAIIESAAQFMPFGYFLMVFGGLLANIAALNATIYSSSRVLFAMARDKFVWAPLSETHELNKTPYRALILSLGMIISICLFLPLKDIASAADILFIALFAQLNLSYIELRRKRPDAEWKYVVPFGVVFPVVAILLYIALGVSLFHVSQIAIYFTFFWALLGLLNYFSYTKTEQREDMEKEISYEHATRFHEKSNYLILLPMQSEKTGGNLSEIAFAIAHEREGDLLAFRVRTVPPTLPLHAGFHTSEGKSLQKIEEAAMEKKINIDTRIIVARSVTSAILNTVSVEKSDLLILGWDGYVKNKGFMFGKHIDSVLRQSKCSLLIVKLADPKNMKKILIPVSVDKNPNLALAGITALSFLNWFGGNITVLMIVPEETKASKYEAYHSLLSERVKELRLSETIIPEVKIVPSDRIAATIVKEGQAHDVIILPATNGRVNRSIGVGSTLEYVAQRSHKTVILAKSRHGFIKSVFKSVMMRF